MPVKQCIGVSEGGWLIVGDMLRDFSYRKNITLKYLNAENHALKH